VLSLFIFDWRYTTSMKGLLDSIRNHTPESFDFEWLGQWVRGLNLEELDLEGHIPSIDGMTDNYARNILLMAPFEVVVIHWPPGVESAIHHHDGFWGYVLCVQGEVENVEYAFDAEKKELREGCALRVRAGGVLPEPDGTIHKIVNPSLDAPLVTVHFYAPALETLDGMVIFDAENGWRGELNERATTASFNQSEDGFRTLEKSAFEYVPISSVPGNRTHRLYPLIPKPSESDILLALKGYYSEQADAYDDLDNGSQKRKAYTDSINGVIAEDLRGHEPSRMLHIACGTGRRAEAIREASGLDYHMDGVDISLSMAEQARKRGVNTRIGHWNELSIERGKYDAATFLYAFGHIPNEAERRKSLVKVSQSLKTGGRFYFDVFNIDNAYEWGPEAMRLFNQLNLDQEGYEKGDLFYKRHGGDTVAFLHYCSESGIVDLVESCGLRVQAVHKIGYVRRPGERLRPEENEGNLLIVAEKV